MSLAGGTDILVCHGHGRPSRPDPHALAGAGAVTTGPRSLEWVGLDKLVSRTTPLVKVSVPLNPERNRRATGGFRIAAGPRNSIEEFDPGSA